MTFDKKKLPLLALPLMAGLGIAGLAAASDQSATAPYDSSAIASIIESTGDLPPAPLPEPFRCEIATSEVGSMIALESLVFVDEAIEGQYSLSVQSAGYAGSANIRQGGSFTAAPGEMVRLGSVMIGNNTAGYIATLEITTPSHAFDCEQQIGGIA